MPQHVQFLQYVALISQSGSDAPVVNALLVNTLGGSVVWSRDSQGNYIATLNGVFTANKTIVFLASANRTYQYVGYQNDVNTVYINTSVTLTGNFTDGALDVTGIEIRVYP